MATFSITIPDAQVIRARNALCAYVGFTGAADQTLVNAKAGLAQLVRTTIRNHEANNALAQATATAEALGEVDVT